MKGTIRKRGSTWSFQIYLGINQENGKPKFTSRTGFNTKKEAEKACAKMISELNAQSMIFDKTMTFGQFGSYWMDTKKESVRESTLMGYRDRIVLHMYPHFQNIRLEDINEIRIRKWMKWLFEKLSSGNAVDSFKLFRQMIRKAIRKRILQYDPFDEIETPKFERKKMEVWTKHDIDKLLSISVNSVYYPVFYLAIATGMRQSEILGLQWDAVNFDNNTISVRSVLDHKTRQIVEKTKTASSTRSVLVSDECMDMLRKHRIKQKERKLSLGTGYTDSDMVCTTEIGTQIRARNLLRAYYHYIQRAGLKRITFHELRHTHATILLSEGLEPAIIKDRLGHSSIDVTIDIYSHVTSNMQKLAADTIAKVMKR